MYVGFGKLLCCDILHIFLPWSCIHVFVHKRQTGYVLVMCLHLTVTTNPPRSTSITTVLFVTWLPVWKNRSQNKTLIRLFSLRPHFPQNSSGADWICRIQCDFFLISFVIETDNDGKHWDWIYFNLQSECSLTWNWSLWISPQEIRNA